MGKKLYVGNLAFSVSSESLEDLFNQVGNVETSKVITDRDSGRSKGFAFVEMSSSEDASKVISKFNGYSLEGRQLNISEARPMAPRDSFGGSAGRRGFAGRY